MFFSTSQMWRASAVAGIGCQQRAKYDLKLRRIGLCMRAINGNICLLWHEGETTLRPVAKPSDMWRVQRWLYAANTELHRPVVCVRNVVTLRRWAEPALCDATPTRWCRLCILGFHTLTKCEKDLLRYQGYVSNKGLQMRIYSLLPYLHLKTIPALNDITRAHVSSHNPSLTKCMKGPMKSQV